MKRHPVVAQRAPNRRASRPALRALAGAATAGMLLCGPATAQQPATGGNPSGIQSEALPPPPGVTSHSLLAPGTTGTAAPASPPLPNVVTPNSGSPAPPPAAAPAIPGTVPPAVTTPSPAGAAPAAPQGSQPPAQPEAPPPNPWLPKGGAVIQVLDKPDAQNATMTIKNGQSATYRSLTISVKACYVRPPDMPADATAFLQITDSHAGQPGFSGWMLESDPSLNMMQNPLYDVRVKGCIP